MSWNSEKDCKIQLFGKMSGLNLCRKEFQNKLINYLKESIRS